LRSARWSRWEASASALARSGLSWAAMRSRGGAGLGEGGCVVAGQVEYPFMPGRVVGVPDAHVRAVAVHRCDDRMRRRVMELAERGWAW
jgi:hypothetical protein